MAMNAAPAATFEVVQTEFLFRFTEAVFYRPASKCHAKNLSQRPAVATRHTIRQKVFCFIGEHITSHDQRTLITDEFVSVSLSPARRPADFPDFTPTMSIFDAILLRCLFSKRRRVCCQVLNFARLSFMRTQPRVDLWTARRVVWRCFQHFRLHHPDVSVRRNLDDKGFVAFVQTIQKRAVATIGFVRRPCHNFDSVGLRVIDQIQRNLWLGLKDNIVRDVCFFRRAGSLAHSSGRYRRASSKQSNPGAE